GLPGAGEGGGTGGGGPAPPGGPVLAGGGAILFGRPQDFFLTVQPSRTSVRARVLRCTATPRRPCNSARVASGCSDTSPSKRVQRSGVIFVAGPPPRGLAANEPVSWRRCSKRRIQAVLTPNSWARAWRECVPASQARTTRSRRSYE